MAEGAAAGDAPAKIQLNVKDQQGSEMDIKITKSTPLRKLMNAYCSRFGLQSSQVRFMVDGERIGPDDTAEKLGLEDEDLIDVAVAMVSVVVTNLNGETLWGPASMTRNMLVDRLKEELLKAMPVRPRQMVRLLYGISELTDESVLDADNIALTALFEPAPAPPEKPPGPNWVEYGDAGVLWWYYDGPMGTWWTTSISEDPQPYPSRSRSRTPLRRRRG